MALDDLVGGPRRTHRPGSLRCRVEAFGPNVGISVTSVNYSASLGYDVPKTQWARGQRDPAPGDECLLVFDDDGDAWVPVGEWHGDA